MKETMEIPLTQGQVAIIDAEDWPIVKDYNWCALWDGQRKGYYAGSRCVQNGKVTTIRMHRLIMNAKKGQIVDHIDGHGINNIKANLRFATFRENALNRRVQKHNTSGVPGVTFDKIQQSWRVRISHYGKRITIGRFKNFEDAVLARNKAVDVYYGEFARRSETVIEKRIDPVRRDTQLVLWHLIGYGDVYVVPLTQDKYSIVDISDYDVVSPYTWWFISNGYAVGSVNGKEILLHRHLAKPQGDLIVDHINGVRLDNIRSNLRCVTPLQNSWNKPGWKPNHGHKCIYPQNGNWAVYLTIHGRRVGFGAYATIEEALEARNAAYEKHRGEYAHYD